MRAVRPDRAEEGTGPAAANDSLPVKVSPVPADLRPERVDNATNVASFV